MAPTLDKDLTTLCKGVFGEALPHGAYSTLDKLQLDHVSDEGTYGKRAPSDAQHLVTVCPFHHATWAVTKQGRRLEREYLQSMR